MLLEPLPTTQPIRLLVGGPCRKEPALFRRHLDTVARQILPPNVELIPAYVDDNTNPETSIMLREFCEERKGFHLDARQQGPEGQYTDTGITHTWDGTAMRRVAQHKNALIQLALTERYDGLWLVDADLLFHDRTLWSLWHSDGPIVCGVFWTRWQDTPGCPSLPQVWLRHPYELGGRGMEPEEFLRHLHDRERVRVWGQGACTLYRRDALVKGLTFDLLPDLPTQGMWQGEDRHLCTRAERLYIPMFGDAWPDIFHVYHPHQLDDGIKWLESGANLDTEGPVRLGHLVSCVLESLEPIPHADGSWAQIPAQHVRGVLGRLPLALDLEDAILTMQRGEQRIVPVRYPRWAPGPFRNGQRLIQVTLVDYKPFNPPVNT